MLTPTRRQCACRLATDMFLNWVYKTLSIGGFENITWKPEESDGNGYYNRPSGCADEIRRPGDARFNWMETEMLDIFADQGWSS